MADRSVSIRLRAEVDQYRRDMDQAARSTAGVAEAAGEAGKQTTAMDQLRDAGRGVGRTLGAVATAAAIGMVGLTAATIATGVQYNTLEQQTRAALTTLLGGTEAAAAQMDDLREFVRTALFPREVFIEAQQQMLAFGFAAESVIPTLAAVQDATAAVGGTGQDMAEIVNILSRMQSTGRITAQELNELGRRGINAAELIGSAMGQTEDQIRQSITSGALDGREAIDLLVNAMETRFAGAAELVSDTWIGASGLVTAALRDIGSAIVEPFIDPRGGGAAVQWARDFADILYAVEGAIRPVVALLRDRAEPAFERVSLRLQQVADAIAGADLAGLVDRVSAAGPAFAAFGAAAAAAGTSSVLAAIGLGSLGAAISPLGAGVAALAVASPELREALLGLLDAARPLVPVIGEAAVLLGQAFTLGVEAVADVLEAVTPLISAVFELFDMLPGPIQAATLAAGAFALALRLGGPVGIALTAIAGLGAAIGGLQEIFGDGADSGQVFRETISELTDDLLRLGRTARVTGGIETALAELDVLGERLDGAADELSDFKRFIQREWLPNVFGPDPVDRLAGIESIEDAGDVLDDFRERLAPLDRALAQLVSSGQVEEAGAAFDMLAARAEALGIPIDVLIELFPEYERQLQRYADSNLDGASAHDDLTESVDETTRALQEFNDQIRAQSDPMFALHKAIQELDAAQQHYNEVLEDSEATQRDVEQASMDLALAALAVHDAAGDAAGVFDGELDPAFRAVLESAGLTEEQIDQVESAFRDAAEAGDDYAKDYVANVEARGLTAVLSQAQQLQNRLSDLHGTRSTVHVDVMRAGGTIVGDFHTGGGVPGTRFAEVPAVLQSGEHIWTVREVQAAGGHANVEAMRAAVLAGATRFHTGGPVGVSRAHPVTPTTVGDPAEARWQVDTMNVNMPTARVSPRQIAEEFAFNAAS